MANDTIAIPVDVTTTPMTMTRFFEEKLDAKTIGWINFATLLVCSVIFSVCYAKSVAPAQLERKLGPKAYPLCGWYRVMACSFMTLAGVNYVVYYWYPLQEVPEILRTFSWPYWISEWIALIITIPCGFLMCRGMYDAGQETVTPRKEQPMYGGIYNHMRHPQAVGEFPLWWTFAFLAHSPFLVLFSFVYAPIWYYFCVVEERDLVLRFGEPYKSYQKRVGCLWPKDWPAFLRSELFAESPGKKSA